MSLKGRFRYHGSRGDRLSVERFFLFNLLMDFLILSASARALRAFRLKRVLAASVAASAYALLPPALHRPAFQLAMLCPTALLVAGRGPLRRAASAAAGICVCCMSAGTAAALPAAWRVPLPTPLAAAPGVALAAGCAVRYGRLSCLRPVALMALRGGACARVDAVIDTGNRLREPLSGQPVLIAESAAVAHLLPSRGVRAVAYGSVGGGGTLQCFRPDAILIERHGRLHRGPEAWIALYPGRLPGGVAALAPADFLE